MDRRPEWMKSLSRLISSTPAAPPAGMPKPTFGTVKQLNPLRIALDNDPLTTLPYSPPCLDYPTYVGQRVWVETYGRQVVIVGISKSSPDLPVGSGGVWTGPVGKEPILPWMLAEGQLLPRVDYPELSALYGNTFTGSTTTHVALPDARGRTAVHYEAGSSLWGTVGGKPGTEDVTLTIPQLPPHSHAPPEGGFYVESSWGVLPRSSPVVSMGTGGEYGTSRQRLAVNGTPLSTGSAGESEPHNNVQPSLVMRYMVKVR